MSWTVEQEVQAMRLGAQLRNETVELLRERSMTADNELRSAIPWECSALSYVECTLPLLLDLLASYGYGEEHRRVMAHMGHALQVLELHQEHCHRMGVVCDGPECWPQALKLWHDYKRSFGL